MSLWVKCSSEFCINEKREPANKCKNKYSRDDFEIKGVIDIKDTAQKY